MGMVKRCARLCADALAGSAAFDRLASPSYTHSIQRERKGGAAVVPFAFTEAERSELAATTGTLIRTDQWLREDRQPCAPDQPVARQTSTSRYRGHQHGHQSVVKRVVN